MKPFHLIPLALLFCFTSAFAGVAHAGDDDGQTYTVFLPLVTASYNPTDLDLQITHIELTQGVANLEGSVPLVANRATIARIYVQASAPVSQPVTVALHATRDGQPLPGSPLTATQPAPTQPTSADFDTTFNFTLPTDWLTGEVEFTADLDCPARLTEASELNNHMGFSARYTDVPALDVVIVPVNYTHTPTGQVFPAPTEDNFSAHLLATFPVSAVNVSWHAPYNFSGNLKDRAQWTLLLQNITMLKLSDNAPTSTVYFAFVDGAYDWWGTSGVAGVAWIGSRTAVGTDLWFSTDTTRHIAAHEVGHTFGRHHAPCLATGDNNYPYAGGYIGHYGVNTHDGRVFDPNFTADIMGYCPNTWVSDYTYTALLDDQLRFTQPSVPAPSGASDNLIIRVRLDDTSAALLPIYPTTSAPTLEPTSPYRLVLRDAAGQPLSEYGLPLLTGHTENFEVGPNARATSDHHDHDDIASIQAVIPGDLTGVATIELWHNGQRRAVQFIAPANAPQAAAPAVEPTLTQHNDGLTLTWHDARPTLVRYTSDGGQTYTTLAIDLTGGELTLPAGQLPAPGATFEIMTAGAGLQTVVFAP